MHATVSMFTNVQVATNSLYVCMYITILRELTKILASATNMTNDSLNKFYSGLMLFHCFQLFVVLPYGL